jgi:hypothetical protein
MVSPRVAHLERVVSENSQRDRGIIHQKHEPLSRADWHRCHLICGDGNLGDTSTWLKVATTAMVVALAEAGISCTSGLQLNDPLAAMRTFATDVGCKAKVPTSDGKQLSAVEIQRQILERIEAHADHPVMPPWTVEACRQLRRVLDLLEHGPGRAARTLDWAIKLAVYRDFVRKHGVRWESLSHWNHVFSRLRRSRQCPSHPQQLPLAAAPRLQRGGVSRAEVRRLAPYLRDHGLQAEDYDAVVTLRHKLFELDFRFGQLGPEGIFTALDDRGVLDHAVPGVDNIEHAEANPPAAGRARARGVCVQNLHARGGECFCDWSAVWDSGPQQRFLDLSDPTRSDTERWDEFADGRHLYELLESSGSPTGDVFGGLLARRERRRSAGGQSVLF